MICTMYSYMQGNYSEIDQSHWTPELKKALNFDQEKAREVDNGEMQIKHVSTLHNMQSCIIICICIYAKFDPIYIYLIKTYLLLYIFFFD